MKIVIRKDEAYPVYTAEPGDEGQLAELTTEEFAAYEAVCNQYEDWQDRLGDLWDQTQRRTK